MKVELTVVQGKPEAKTITLVGPVFKVGRGETCHLRPNNERVSREHAEFTVSDNTVTIRDLGSRNGTLVNGRALTQPRRLKDGDRVQIGPMVFAVSVSEIDLEEGMPILVDEPARAGFDWQTPPEDPFLSRGPAVSHGQETLLIPAFTDPSPLASGILLSGEDDEAYERLPISDAETATEISTVGDLFALIAPAIEAAPTPEAAAQEPAAGKSQSVAAMEILRTMMKRCRVQ